MRVWVTLALALSTSSIGAAQEPAEASEQSAPDEETGVEAAGEEEPADEGAEAEESSDEPDEETSPEIEEARSRYRQGVAFFRAEAYREAIAEFSQAYELWQNPAILFSLGQAHERLLQVPEAIEFFERFLAEAEADDPKRSQVDGKLDTLRMLLATVIVESNVEGEVFVDGRPAGSAPGEIQMATGEHTIEVRARGHERSSQRIQVAARTERTLTFELEAIRIEQHETVVVEGNQGISPVWGWSALGLAVASGGAALGLGLATLNAAEDYDDDPLRTVDAQSDGERLALLTDIMIGATALFTTAAVVLLLLQEKKSDDDEVDVSASASGGFIRYSHRF